MKNRILFPLLLLATLLLSACQAPAPQKTIVGSNTLAAEERPVGAIRAVEMSGFGRLVVAQGENESLTVEAEDNFLPYLVTEMRGDTLVIRMKPLFSFKPNRPIVYRLTVRSLEAIRLNGFAEAEVNGLQVRNVEIRLKEFSRLAFTDLDADTLDARISGFSRLEVTGVVKKAAVDRKESAVYEDNGLTLR